MIRQFMSVLILSFGMSACGERAPVDWMYGEYKSLFSLCPESGQKIERKSSTASLTYTWSCPYPKDFEGWLSGFEEKHLTPRGWAKGKTLHPYTWSTYCSSHQKVVMRIVKVEAKKINEDDRLWISNRFPGDECPSVLKGDN
jgi:hypothetical protein